jgi:hypothetical protein
VWKAIGGGRIVHIRFADIHRVTDTLNVLSRQGISPDAAPIAPNEWSKEQDERLHIFLSLGKIR